MVDPKVVAEQKAGKAATVSVVVPLYHVYGLVGVNMILLAGGAHLVILPKFEPHSYLRSIEKYKVSKNKTKENV